MSFDAGAITGKLGLDVSAFTGGLVGAGAAAGGFQSIIAASVIDPLLGVAAAAEKAAGALGHLVSEFGESSAATSLAAEKAGVSVEYFSRLAAVGKSVGVSAEQIGTGFKLLQRNAVDALEGNEKAAKSFRDVGISMGFLKDHLADNEGLMEAVRDGLGSIESPAQRTQRAIEVLGRQGSELVPLFNMTGAAAKKLADDMGRMGAVETEHGAKLGRDFKVLETYVGGAWEGIKRAVSEPVLEFLSKHMDEILPRIQRFAEVVEKLIGKLFKRLMPEIERLWPEVLKFVDEVMNYLEKHGDEWVEFIGTLGKVIVDILIPALRQLTAELKVLGPLTTPILGLATGQLDMTHKLIKGVTEPVGLDDREAPGGRRRSGGGTAGGADVNVNTTVYVDGQDVADKVVNDLHPKIKKQYDEATARFASHVSHQATAKGIGGKNR